VRSPLGDWRACCRAVHRRKSGCGDDRTGAGGRADNAERVAPRLLKQGSSPGCGGQDRHFSEKADAPHRFAKIPDGNTEKGTYYRWIELVPRVTDQLLTRRLWFYRSFVGTRRDHDFVGVSDGDDAATQRYLGTDETSRVSTAPKPLVVLFDSQGPGPQPRCEGSHELFAVDGVLLERLPFIVCRLPWLAEDLGWYPKLAYVME
jgi:hypothetical protein